MNRIEFKELEFPSVDVENEKNKFLNEMADIYRQKYEILPPCSIIEFCYINAESIAERKKQILNKKVELTKDDIIKVFEGAGFEYDEEQLEVIICKEIKVRFTIDNGACYLLFKYKGIDCDAESPYIKLNDIKSIKFYYKQFCEMFNFELSKVEND